MSTAFALEVLRAVQVQMAEDLKAFPRYDVFLCHSAARVGGWDYRDVLRDMLQEDGIPDSGAGFNHAGIKGELVPCAVSANERRRIWLARKIEELSA